MRFVIRHLDFDTGVITCDENTLPDWLKMKGFRWWLDDYVLNLSIGKHIDSDFHRIHRISGTCPLLTNKTVSGTIPQQKQGA